MVDKNKKEEPLDLDALLNAPDTGKLSPEDPAVVAKTEPVSEPTGVEENETLRRIREVEAELAKPSPESEPEPQPFVPTAKLSPEEKKLRDLEDALARKRTAEAERAPQAYDNATAEDGDEILIHFLVDGFVANGVTWFRGQEVSFIRGSEAYEQTKNRHGWSWLELADDVQGQYKKWGKQYFARGPWPGRRWDDTEGMTPEEKQLAEAAAVAEAKRGRRAPVVKI